MSDVRSKTTYPFRHRAPPAFMVFVALMYESKCVPKRRSRCRVGLNDAPWDQIAQRIIFYTLEIR
jgi:hypothetical protein